MTAGRQRDKIDLEKGTFEYNVIKQKLDSKVEALHILSKELDQCRSERDQYKLMASQLRERCAALRKSIESKADLAEKPTDKSGPFKNSRALDKLVNELREQNKSNQFEVNDLKQKLEDAQGDMRLLREQIARQRVGNADEGVNTRIFPAHERETLVTQLEGLKVKYNLVEKDLQTILDEKEELIVERDSYKNKVERLNHQLNHVLKGDDKKVIDIDALLMENRYLQERLKQTQEEKSLYLQTLSKYKNILEKRKNKSPMSIGVNGKSGVIITHKQVEKMLHNSKSCDLPATQATIADLRSLALALFESLNDKSTALIHQRKTNKLLGTRVGELDGKLLSLEEITLQKGTAVDFSANFNPADENSSRENNLQEMIKETFECADESTQCQDIPVVEAVPRNDHAIHRRQCHSESLVITENDEFCQTRKQRSESEPSIYPRFQVTRDLLLPEKTLKSDNSLDNYDDLPPALSQMVKDAMQDLENSPAKDLHCRDN